MQQLRGSGDCQELTGLNLEKSLPNEESTVPHTKKKEHCCNYYNWWQTKNQLFARSIMAHQQEPRVGVFEELIVKASISEDFTHIDNDCY